MYLYESHDAEWKLLYLLLISHIFSHGWVIVRGLSGVNNICEGSKVKLSRISTPLRHFIASKITNVDPELAFLQTQVTGKFFSIVWAQNTQTHEQHTQKRRDRERDGETDGSPALFVMQIDVSQCDKCTVKGKTTKLFHLSQYSSTTTGLIATLSHEQRPD